MDIDYHNLPLFWEPVRRTDPPTSWAGADAVRPRAGTLRARVLELFLSQGPMTHEELCDRYRQMFNEAIQDHTIRPRCNELQKVGLVENSGERRLSKSGVLVATWRATEKAAAMKP